MLSTKNLVNDYKDVPASFIFEYYAKLNIKLTGQEIKIKSLFNDKDDTPSMSIYIDKNTKTYKFKDFSTGIGGSAINMVMELRGLSFNKAATTIVNDYNNYKLNNPDEVINFKEQAKYKVTDYSIRKWNTNDRDFWTDFYIDTDFLNEYMIKPFSYYTMTKKDESVVKEINIKGEYIYGYFTKSGELYKIYQPKNKERKYIKVKAYIQGSEQLQGHETLFIQSGIKDIGAMKSLRLKIDYLAPDSENVMIKPDVMKKLKREYKKIFVMFDNDEAGIKAMKKYREAYNVDCILLTTAKDAAESIKAKGPRDIRQRVISLIELKSFNFS